MSRLSIIIPVGPAHTHVWHEAADCVEAQTVPCDLIVQHDTQGKGAGWARNKALAQVQTELVAFLDADDIIDPHFAEICLGILDQYRAAGNTDVRYLYTDWYGVNNQRHIAPSPCEAWTNNTAHLVTAVVPTERARLIGGFDEVMTGVEDADFYVRLRLSGVCGLHVEAPLVSYREGGQRSVTARASGAESRAKQYMTTRYGGFSFMACCGDPTPGPTGPTNQPQEGDVLAQAQWQGNRQERGRVTGRLYERTSFPKTVYVNAEDVAAAPQHWKRVANPAQAATGVVLQPQYAPVNDWQYVAEAYFGGGTPQAAPQPIEYKPNVPGKSKAQVVKGLQS